MYWKLVGHEKLQFSKVVRSPEKFGNHYFNYLCFIVIQLTFLITVLNIVKNVKNGQLENHEH
ncbi:hypothetical protein T07_13430 [Trichinella nelsoni]|uniref:Uncharacterized protein n=1 Tax=Trichinella nelsoni TaxID=6336 RepID=A0A0V0REG9_9BILA|nr:hypothetical protein T07_13430 [Trichinella nelsoni]